MSITPAYRLMFRQTITVFNPHKLNGAQEYKRTVIHKGAKLNNERYFRETTTGSTAGSQFLLGIYQGADGKFFVEPQDFKAEENTYTINNNDKIVRGEWPEITTSAEWAKFIPTSVAGLVAVKSYDPVFDFDGNLVHIEVGG